MRPIKDYTPSLEHNDDLKQFDVLKAELKDTEALIKIFEVFLKDAPRRVDKIRSFAIYGNFKGMSQEAHALKSSASLLHSSKIPGICAALEKCTDKNLSLSLLKELEAHYEVFKGQLTLYRRLNHLY